MGEEAVSSPKNRVKFLCSYGGKILPRPSDGQLKYVGGVTRVVAVPRDITFSELMKKVTGLLEGDLVLKYQLIPEELDTLVSVTCDEDLNHMLDEYNRLSKSSSHGGAPRFRTFLFPSTPITSSSIAGDSTTNPLEQRYVDAINGILRSPSSVGHSIFTVSSTGSSPKSIAPETSYNSDHDAVMCNSVVGCSHHSRCIQQEVHKVHSSPNLLSNGPYQHTHHQHFHHNMLVGKPMPPAVTVRADAARIQTGQAVRYYSPVGPCRVSGGYVGCGHMDGCGAYRSGGLGDGDGLPRSPMRHRWE
ncbi:uncharacterized protein LOC131242807 [Magnolia sinica]|uniref:uncharacterized protein LOC131235983 n=1 Tax=Magnolia sinica TaxID=86752 RepID=UPI00265A3362|nr:uncharacterized protein LOC131235983 [Magnolia sinica]XP_058089072.1 uncharacterized protein LOC131235983 [Magnolia sinica]XP_058097682.1 uncharacterized protein LOC131242807 [Magnolia sinica]XP_058097683.1 uncharacterized protein LOC131242807 [Magnolia sinica]XP_058097684.1 uncharacterized protein LOC131242807 [Magnolia sinica]XP_058097685.1 uncharacterized protein LOC131242807 [Magnolia sinica]